VSKVTAQEAHGLEEVAGDDQAPRAESIDEHGSERRQRQGQDHGDGQDDPDSRKRQTGDDVDVEHRDGHEDLRAQRVAEERNEEATCSTQAEQRHPPHMRFLSYRVVSYGRAYAAPLVINFAGLHGCAIT